jgi:hypothetical protein
MRRARILRGLVIIGVLVLLGVGVAAWWFWPATEPPKWANEYDLNATEPEEIAPGTVIERSAPAGWSHLIIKSLPRVKPSEVPQVPPPPFGLGRDYVIRQVSWMFTVFTADVVKEQHGLHSRYRLRAIGLGLGTTVNGRDIVLTVETAAQYGVKLDPIQSKTLEVGYKIQKQSRVVVHGPSFALVDTPVAFRCDGTNRMVRFRYAMLVDAHTGRLDVFSWRAGAEEGQCADLARAVLLYPNTIDEAELIPDPKQFTAGAPNELGFGVDDLPPNRLEVVVPTELRTLAGQMRFTPDEAHALEVGLRKLLPK